jgi:hypothetical protein
MPITAVANVSSDLVDVTTIPAGALAGVVLTNGVAPLTANWNAGNFTITSANSVDVINVLERGLVNDGITDNTAAFNTLMTAIGANSGKTVYFPGGIYIFASAPATLGNFAEIWFRGEGNFNAGAGGGAVGSVLRFTGTGAGNFLTVGGAGPASGLRFSGLCFDYTSASFTGILINGDGTTGNSLNYSQFYQCSFGSTTNARTAAFLLSLENSVDVSVTDCQFSDALYAVRGVNTSGQASNVVTFRQAIFQRLVTGTVRNPGQAWSFYGCTFEFLVAGTANAIECPAANPAQGLHISGCWFGDYTSGTSTVLSLNARGVSITGNAFYGIATTTHIALNSGSALGVSITGNYFQTGSVGVSISNSTSGVIISGNEFSGITTPYTAPGSLTGVSQFWFTGNHGALDYVFSGVIGPVFSQSADSNTTANSLTTIFGTGVGSLTIPANALAVGRAIRIHAGGYCSTADGGAGTKTLAVILGGVTVGTGTSGATFQTVVNNIWKIDVTIVCRSAGAGGSVSADATFITQIATATPVGLLTGSAIVGGINTTGTLALDVQYNNGNATGSIRTNHAIVEILEVL